MVDVHVTLLKGTSDPLFTRRYDVFVVIIHIGEHC